MIKLNKYVSQLEELIEKIELKQDELQEKINSIDEKCWDEDREWTKAEENRILTYQEQIEELENEKDSVQNAIDYLSDYVE